MKLRIVALAASLASLGFAVIPGTEAWNYCDGVDNDVAFGYTPPTDVDVIWGYNPNAPDDAWVHNFDVAGPVARPSKVGYSNTPANGASLAEVYSMNDQWYCTTTELALTDGDGEWEEGVNGAAFSFADVSPMGCDGYGDGDHHTLGPVEAYNLPFVTNLAWFTGTDGPIEDPLTPGAPLLGDWCTGNGVITEDPIMDPWDCVSQNPHLGLNLGFFVTPSGYPQPNWWGNCYWTAVDQMMWTFLVDGPVVVGGPELTECCAHTAYALGWATGGATGPFSAFCLNGSTVIGNPIGPDAATSSNNPWHKYCATYAGTSVTVPTITLLSVPITGVIVDV